MKKTITTLSMILCLNILLCSQPPQAFKYQAIARSGSGDILATQEISLRVNILQGSSDGPVVYAEKHTVTTNEFGLVNINIGKGRTGDGERNDLTGHRLTANGHLNDIDWSIGNYFLKIEIDPEGGSNYKVMGISQLLSVPYALYAGSAGNSGSRSGEWNNLPYSRVFLHNDFAGANVGIGTTIPVGKLHVQGEGFSSPAAPMLMMEHRSGYSSTFRRVVNNAGNALFLLQKARGSAIDAPSVVQVNDNIGQIRMEGFDGTNYIEAGYVRVLVDNGVTTGSVPGALVFATTPSGSPTSQERVRISSSGNVGIGTTNPGALLDVSGGNAKIECSYQADNRPALLVKNESGLSGNSPAFQTFGIFSSASSDGSDSKYGVMTYASGDGGSKTALYASASGTGTNFAGYFNNGNVYIKNNLGIGTNNPTATLHISNPSVKIGPQEYELSLEIDGADVKLGDMGATQYGNYLYINGENGGNFQFLYGSVGIGSTDPLYPLDVNGIVNATNFYKNGTELAESQWQGSADIYYNGGNVGIGSTEPGYLLDVDGLINATNIYKNGSAIVEGKWSGTTNIYYTGGNVGVGTTNPVADLHITGSPTLAKVLLTPNEPSTGDDSEIFLAEDHDATYGMSVVYDGGDNNLYIYGKSSSTIYGPHLCVERDDGNIGIGTTIPGAKLHIVSDDGIFTKGTIDQGGVLPGIGGGPYMFWYPRKAAFRAGYVYAGAWDESNIGKYSTAFGRESMASGQESVTWGYHNEASGDNTTAFGDNCLAIGEESIAFGHGCEAIHDNTIAGGYSSEARGEYAIALGFNVEAVGKQSLALGKYLNAQSLHCIALGTYNLGFGDSLVYHTTDPILEVGIGTGEATRGNALTILKNGNIGIGTTMPGTVMAVSGLTGTSSYSNVRVNTATGDLYYATSTSKMKDNIQVLEDDFSLILKAEPKSYIDKTSGLEEIGLIAEEMEGIGLTNLVIYDKKGSVISVDYEKVSLYLLEIIKGMKTEMIEMDKRINILEHKKHP